MKDLRNKIENTNPTSVLDGNIDQFIEEELKTDNEKILLSIFLLVFFFTILIILLSTTGIETKDLTTLSLIELIKLIKM